MMIVTDPIGLGNWGLYFPEDTENDDMSEGPECEESPTGNHEWVWSGIPKGGEWCKHCDKDKHETGER